MKKFAIFGALWGVVLGLSVAYGGDPPQNQGSGPESAPIMHRNVTGTIDKIEAGLVFLKTEEGTTRNFALKSARKEGIEKLKPGDQVTVELDEGNQIVDIHKTASTAKKDESESTDRGGAIQGAPHRLITGTVENFDTAKRDVTIKSDQGKLENLQLKDAAFTKLNGAKKGDKVTLELDEQNRVMDVHRDNS